MRGKTLKASPKRGKLSAKRTDEGRRCLYNPSKGYCKNFAPHPASGGASATFSLRAKSRLRRLRSDTRLRAQPQGGSQTQKKARPTQDVPFHL